ncbi:hypothetical protein CTH30272_02849 [Allocatenococcus thiocycli]|nr:hypothetical protein CTH30272_02849 [Catenococcus thiocycli]
MSDLNNLDIKFLLAAQFGVKPAIELEKLCELVLKIGYKRASTLAKNHELPFPAFRLIESQKSPWLVSINDLASYMEAKIAEEKAQWQRMQCYL